MSFVTFTNEIEDTTAPAVLVQESEDHTNATLFVFGPQSAGYMFYVPVQGQHATDADGKGFYYVPATEPPANGTTDGTTTETTSDLYGGV